MKDKRVGNILGGRPRDDDCYTNNTNTDPKIVYENVMKKTWYREGIYALIDLAKKKKTVIMCSEEDPFKCHRHHLITQSLLRGNVAVIHIRKSGFLELVEKSKKGMVQSTLI